MQAPKRGRTIKERLAAALTQFAIIVTGVLVALAADSAWERYRDRQVAYSTLELLLDDMKREAGTFEHYWVELHDNCAAARKRLERFLDGGDERVDPYQFVQDLILVSSYFDHDPRDATLEELRNSRGFGLIENAQLRAAILDYVQELGNVAEFDRVYRAHVVEVAGRTLPRIVNGLALTAGFRSLHDGFTSPKLVAEARTAAEDSLDVASIREGDALRELLIATEQSFLVQRDRYKILRMRATELVDRLTAALAE
ncbi:MAG: hypothetical protein ACYTG5_14850 [Planctomycetota bacterium]|jgi:hypothetical protein